MQKHVSDYLERLERVRFVVVQSEHVVHIESRLHERYCRQVGKYVYYEQVLGDLRYGIKEICHCFESLCLALKTQK